MAGLDEGLCDPSRVKGEEECSAHRSHLVLRVRQERQARETRFAFDRGMPGIGDCIGCESIG